MKLAGLFSSPAASTPSSSLLGRLFKPALGVALSLATAAAMAAPTNMKIATVVWIGYGPFYVAESLDLFKKYNLKVSLQVFTEIFRFYEFTEAEQQRGLELARQFAASSEGKLKSHIRDPKAGQWRDLFTPKVKRHFEEHHGALLERYGYT